MAAGSLLLLAPSIGFGGGIERVSDVVESCWPGPTHRVNLYDARTVKRPAKAPARKAALLWRTSHAAVRIRPEVVLALHVGLLPASFAAARLSGGETAFFAHGREVWRPMGLVRRTLVRRAFPRLAISPFTADLLARRAGIPPETVIRIDFPVAPPFAQAATETGRPASSSRFDLLSVSRITRECRYKGHHDVLASVAEMVADGDAVRWTVVGDGDDLPALRRQCAVLGIERHVDFRGRVTDDELVELYRRADVHVLPSIAKPDADPPVGEGFGLVYAEAGAFGVPSVACTQGGGSSAFVRHGETGLTVPPESPMAITQALRQLRDDPVLRQRLGEAARARVRKHHLPEQFTHALLDAFTPDHPMRRRR